jgi:type IV secretory pathway ATPase VirB11/archaellum biosynthesis ATPase
MFKKLMKNKMSLFYLNKIDHVVMLDYVSMIINEIPSKSKILIINDSEIEINISKIKTKASVIFMSSGSDKFRNTLKAALRCEIEYFILIETETELKNAIMLVESGVEQVFSINCKKINKKTVNNLEDIDYIKKIDLNKVLIKNKLENF